MSTNYLGNWWSLKRSNMGIGKEEKESSTRKG